MKLLQQMLVGLICLIPATAAAQVLTTANPGGGGKNTVVVALPYEAKDDVGIHTPYLAYVRGVSDWLDLHTSVSAQISNAQKRLRGSMGLNLRLFRLNGNSLSVFGSADVPFRRSDTVSDMRLNTAVVLSRVVTSNLTVYTGANWVIPVDRGQREVFAWDAREFSIPVGAAVDMEVFTILTELKFGRMSSLGLAIRKTF